MPVAELLDGFEVKRVTERVSYHNCLGLGRQSLFKFCNVYVVFRHGDIYENRDSTVLDAGCHGGRKTASHGDDLVASLDLAVTELW